MSFADIIKFINQQTKWATPNFQVSFHKNKYKNCMQDSNKSIRIIVVT